MANHKKYPIFIRIRTTDKDVICINPQHLSSFQIIEQAQVRTNVSAEVPEGTVVEADTIRFYFPQGTHLSYSAGIDITQEEFNYVCGALLEYLYLSEPEFRAKSKALADERVALWNKTMEESEAENEAMQEAPKDTSVTAEG